MYQKRIATVAADADGNFHQPPSLVVVEGASLIDRKKSDFLLQGKK